MSCAARKKCCVLCGAGGGWLLVRRRLNVAAFWMLIALAAAPSLLSYADGCAVVIVSPSSGTFVDEGSPLLLSFRIKSSANSSCPSTALVHVHIDGEFVQKHEHPCDSFLPVTATAPPLSCCQRVVELCAHDVPASCARSTVAVRRPQSPHPWMPATSGQLTSAFVAHSPELAAALHRLLPSHDPLLDMSCDRYLLSHRGARVSASGDALTHLYDYSRAPLSQFSHCVHECMRVLPSPPLAAATTLQPETNATTSSAAVFMTLHPPLSAILLRFPLSTSSAPPPCTN